MGKVEKITIKLAMLFIGLSLLFPARVLALQTGPQLVCPYCGEEPDMEVGPDEEMQSMGFAECISELDETYKVTSAFRYVEELVDIIQIANEDEVPE